MRKKSINRSINQDRHCEEAFKADEAIQSFLPWLSELLRSFQSLAMTFVACFLISSPCLAQTPGVTVLELYTSQGCSSCPPADRLMLDLVKQPDIIAFACHVTYFDRQGWADNLAIRPCNMRQSSYKKSGVTEKIYTPQVIVNGRTVAVGSHESTVRGMLRSQDPVAVIDLTRNGNYLNIDLPAMSLKKPATLWVLAYDDLHSRGNIKYVNAVRHMARLMDWNGRALKMALPVDGIKVGGYIVLAQYADNMDIVAAGKTGN
jgi:hypothetical protein